MFALVKI